MDPRPSSGSEWAHSIAVQPDGRIMLGGYQDTSYGLVRFHTNGTLDPSFGSGRIVIPPFGFSGFGDLRMALQSSRSLLPPKPVRRLRMEVEGSNLKRLGRVLL